MLEPALDEDQFAGPDALPWTALQPLPSRPLPVLPTRWRDAQAGLLPAPRLLARYPALSAALALGLLAWSILTVTAPASSQIWRAGLAAAAGLGLLSVVMGRRLAAGWLKR